MGVAIVALTACADMDRSTLTNFYPAADGAFRYEAKGGDPSIGGSAEAQRIQWLDGYLSANGLCAAGYEVTDRKSWEISTNVFGDPFYRIDYEGHCT